MIHTVENGDPSAPDVASLLSEGETHSRSLYPPEGVHTLPVAELRSDAVIFKVVRDEISRAVACGAVCFDGDGWAEIKRMYVARHARNQGLGTVLLGHLETLTGRRDATLVRLETGPLQVEALSLYRRMGYLERGPFGAYRDDPSSVFMEKSLPEVEDIVEAPAFPKAYVDLGERIGRYDGINERADALIERLALRPGDRVLDVPCGVGQLSAALHQRGCSVVGIDLSTPQIGHARQLHPGPDYRVGDMRDRLDQTFDAIVNLFSSFGYFERADDDIAVLRRWHDALRPGGHLVIETTDRTRVRKLVDPNRPNVVVHTPDFLVETRVDAGFRRLVTRYEHRGRHCMSCAIRLYTTDELVSLCRSVGFERIEQAGDLRGSARVNTDRLVLFARRPESTAARGTRPVGRIKRNPTQAGRE